MRLTPPSEGKSGVKRGCRSRRCEELCKRSVWLAVFRRLQRLTPFSHSWWFVSVTSRAEQAAEKDKACTHGQNWKNVFLP
mmetsp:Transcript_144313/g.261995  ORF Transcript_144313/g.261995 Transcript_144313/m.261995 type:complete len:80 (+) Transcript_144313:806-1045(+)